MLLVFFSACNNIASAQITAADSSLQSDGPRLALPCDNTLAMPCNQRNSSLRLGISPAYGTFRDIGTAPISFFGPALQSVVGIWQERSRWHFRLDIATTLGYYEDAPKPHFNFTSFDISNSLRIAAMHLLNAHPRSSEWLGFGLANFLNVTVNTNYENAAAGISNFLGPELYFKELLHLGSSRWLFYGEVGMMPVAALLRPGYAYIDNYTAYQPVLSALFSNYRWNAKFLAGLSTEIGFLFHFLNSNRLQLAYRWELFSSGTVGCWRFDHAIHSLQCNLFFHLKRTANHEKNKN